MTVQVVAGLDARRAHPLGLAGPAFETEVYRLPFESLRAVSLVGPRP
jgi:hypothetical protein